MNFCTNDTRESYQSCILSLDSWVQSSIMAGKRAISLPGRRGERYPDCPMQAIRLAMALTAALLLPLKGRSLTPKSGHITPKSVSFSRIPGRNIGISPLLVAVLATTVSYTAISRGIPGSRLLYSRYANRRLPEGDVTAFGQRRDDLIELLRSRFGYRFLRQRGSTATGPDASAFLIS